ncbi:hypothetical protein PMZ80_002775 [Knufia obscura]|uniref:Uncharacterized protein n=2 Tax=Knufia TaxID=430999 RepID=A0AAN8ECU6_9EURO|nr:hypothetical protein PMZ80_002775 [Knufia obscura]KAK5948368.1 hypothetical protein OHC33_010542 [Knufia fluminis]
MAFNMKIGLACLLLAPALVSATSFEYYRSVFCDAQSPDFFIDRYTSSQSVADDKICHQTPAGTMAMKLIDGIDSSCVVLAYEDYGCSSLVGSVPASGKCVAATKAKIGSWQVNCNSTDTSSASAAVTSFAPGELKRRGKYRLPAIRDDANMTNVTTDPLATASSIGNEISSAISASATDTAAAGITSSPSAGAALSSAVSSGSELAYNLTSYVTDTAASVTATGAMNGTGTPSMTATTAPTITYTGSKNENGTVTFQKGAAAAVEIGKGRILVTVLIGVLAVVGAAVAL